MTGGRHSVTPDLGVPKAGRYFTNIPKTSRRGRHKEPHTDNTHIQASSTLTLSNGV